MLAQFLLRVHREQGLLERRSAHERLAHCSRLHTGDRIEQICGANDSVSEAGCDAHAGRRRRSTFICENAAVEVDALCESFG